MILRVLYLIVGVCSLCQHSVGYLHHIGGVMPEGEIEIHEFYFLINDSRVIVGITQYSNKNHLARAVLEAVCFQSREVIRSVVNK